MSWADLARALFAAALAFGGSALVAWGIYRAGLRQERVRTTLSQHEAYYSARFAKERARAAAFFMILNSRYPPGTDPYDTREPKLSGYSEVIRFWHRLAVLNRHGRIDPELAAELFGYELGWWFGFGFAVMEKRENWRVRPLIVELAKTLRRHGGEALLETGHADGTAKRARLPNRGTPTVPPPRQFKRTK
jgi:hypothetical protein